MIERDILEQWADTVASGDVPQTYGALRDQYGMCVVGVLCDLHPDLQWQQVPEGTDPVHDWMVVDKGADGGASTRGFGNLPGSFVRRYLDDLDDEFFGELIADNDAGISWERLADKVRDRWLR